MENEPITAGKTGDGLTAGPATTKPLLNKEELSGFYRKRLPELIRTFFLQPISGTFSLLSNPDAGTYSQSLILMGSAALLYTIFPYLLLPAQLREYMGLSAALKIGITTIIFMLLVSALAFAIKSVSGKTNFKNELMTGALCAIPLTLLLVIVLLGRLFIGEENLYSLALDPSGIIGKSILGLILIFYVLLFLINILQQSLKAGGTKDALAWYLSPLGILLSAYLTVRIGTGLF